MLAALFRRLLLPACRPGRCCLWKPVCPTLLFCIAFLPAFSGHAQTATDTLPAAPAVIYQHYLKEVGGAARLYTGVEYVSSYPMAAGSPFLDDRSFRNGTVCYDGVTYTDIPLAYDLVQNEVVIKGYQQLAIRLEKAKVCGFRIAGRRFVHLEGGAGENGLPDDFYELLYNGESQVYVKRSKVVVRSLHAEGQDRLVVQDQFFLERNNRFFRLNKEKDLLAVFPDQKNAMKALWKEHSLDFKTSPETFILQTLTLWSQRQP